MDSVCAVLVRRARGYMFALPCERIMFAPPRVMTMRIMFAPSYDDEAGARFVRW